MILGKLHPQEKVFKSSQESVRDIFVEGHATAKRCAADNARAQHHVIDVVRHHAGHGSHQQWRVLVIGVHHDDHIGASGQRLAIAGLLVAPVAIISIVNEDLKTQLLRYLDGAVRAVVVDKDTDIHKLGKLADRSFQGLLRVVSGHDNRNTSAVDHSPPKFKARCGSTLFARL